MAQLSTRCWHVPLSKPRRLGSTKFRWLLNWRWAGNQNTGVSHTAAHNNLLPQRHAHPLPQKHTAAHSHAHKHRARHSNRHTHVPCCDQSPRCAPMTHRVRGQAPYRGFDRAESRAAAWRDPYAAVRQAVALRPLDADPHVRTLACPAAVTHPVSEEVENVARQREAIRRTRYQGRLLRKAT